jgi:hypothetical protein
MCDVPMLAFWVWAVVLWVEGMERNEAWRLAGAGLLIALAMLTKYFGLCLIPLLAVYSLIRQRRLGRWAVYLLIPLVMIGVYQSVTRMLYGHGLIFMAADFAIVAKAWRFSQLTTGLTALTFTGGCLASVLFFAPLFWQRRLWIWCLSITAVLAAACFWNGTWLKQFYGRVPNTFLLSVKIQMVFWAIGGIGLLALAIMDVWRRRDANAWLLALWTLGTFSFTAFFNWTVNGRSLLPMAPAMGILLARGLEQKAPAGLKNWTRRVTMGFIPGAVLALLTTRADFLFATAFNRSAQQVCAKYGHESHTLWFEGHWGFQYYMNALGASALDLEHPTIAAGDILALPTNNHKVFSPDPQLVTWLDVFTIPESGVLATMDESVGAGFYASVWGPLPFVFGPVPPEKVFVFVVKSPNTQ